MVRCNNLSIAFLGLGLATAKLTKVVVSPDLTARGSSINELRGQQTCKKCNKKGMTNFCDGSTFEKGDKKEWAAGGQAVKVGDCKTLMDQLSGTNQQSFVVFPVESINANEWNVVTSSQTGNCAFALKAGGAMSGSSGLAMGSGDVFDLVRDSIAKFAEVGKVTAHGKAFCRGQGADLRFADAEVAWKVFNPYG
ncbi:uncharacterized protein PG986_000516 [Apiospora aurea]|uniref:Ecp2 effector protein-like domain-containing protein n=1 Tax=Apiospora aurea TaxID=335848 RepID=A0ABR1QUG4_9PEZI